MVRRLPAPDPIHLKPAAELAERVLLPGDPHRALAVAQALLDEPRMFNHHRGLWGYTGAAPDGEAMSVQATGMGGPSAAIVCEELVNLGARVLVRIGTCGGLLPEMALGELVVATESIPADGASAALGARRPLVADERLTAALSEAAAARGEARAGPVVSSDLFYDDREELAAGWREQGAVAVEMETATILRIAQRREVAAACVLGVSDLLGAEEPARTRISREGMEEVGIRLGDVAVDALTALGHAGAG